MMFLQILGAFGLVSISFIAGYICCAVMSMNNRK